ncbi:MAG: RDD family protein [Clostridiaceae bacterium]|nr:RDD family protein [Clostridiaceae bacterium]
MQNNMNQQVYAGFFVRLSAYLIDWILVGAALLLIRIPVFIAYLAGSADLILRDVIFEYSVYDILIYVLKVVYFTFMTYYTGATLGKRLLHIRVISTEDRKPSFFEILFRESVGKFLSGLILYVGYIMIGVEKNKRGLHDILSDTYVVYCHEKRVMVPAPVVYRNVPYHENSSVPNGMPSQNGNTMPSQNGNTMPLQNENGMPSQNGNTMPLQNENGMPSQNEKKGSSQSENV